MDIQGGFQLFYLERLGWIIKCRINGGKNNFGPYFFSNDEWYANYSS